MRCGRRRSCDHNDRGVGLSPGARNTTLNQRAVERTLCSDQSAHAGGWITRGEVLICTTDE